MMAVAGGLQVVIMVPPQHLGKMLQASVAQETHSSRGRVGGGWEGRDKIPALASAMQVQKTDTGRAAAVTVEWQQQRPQQQPQRAEE